ncbi:MAG: hypothetical protein U0R77_02180 [Mycolicibacterium insubricum]
MRTILTGLLWLLTTLTLAVAVPAGWAQQNLIRADGYAALAQRAASDQQLQAAVASQLSTQIVNLAGAESDIKPAVIRVVATSYTRSSAFPAQFAQANRYAHRWLFTNTIRSDVDERGRWVIDLAPMLADSAFQQTLTDYNITVPTTVPVPLTENAPSALRPGVLRSAAVWGPWISIGAGVLAAVFAVLMLWSSRRLGRGLTALGLSGLLVGGAGWAALEIGRGKVENALNQSAPDVRQAADAVVATVTASTHQWLNLALVIGGGLVVVGVILTLLGGLRRAH